MERIFILLEDESKKRAPLAVNLQNMIVNTCADKPEFEIQKKSSEYCFTIRHSAKNVCYSTVKYFSNRHKKKLSIFIFLVTNTMH